MNMTGSNSTALRGALARAIKSHVEMKGLNGVQAAKECGIANSRMSTILRGQVEKISSDALVDILGTLGYRLDSVIGATEGHEFTLTLDEGLGLPKDIKPPITPEIAAALQEEVKATRYYYAEADPDANRVIADE
jgi:predicted XRE-type DNA-binding protein